MREDITLAAQLLYGIAPVNPVASIDYYYGVYNTPNDALEIVPDELKVVGRQFAVYTDYDQEKVKLYTFSKSNDIWTYTPVETLTTLDKPEIKDNTLTLKYTGEDNIQQTQEVILPITDKTFIHDQHQPDSLWTITHNMNKYPSVSVVDTSQREVLGHVKHLDKNTLTIEFNSIFSGYAYLN